MLATQAKMLVAGKKSIILVIKLYFLKKLAYFLEKPLREQVGISKPMNPQQAKKIIVEVSKECYKKYCMKKEVKKNALLENIHKMFHSLLNKAKERRCVQRKEPEVIIDAEEIK